MGLASFDFSQSDIRVPSQKRAHLEPLEIAALWVFQLNKVYLKQAQPHVFQPVSATRGLPEAAPRRALQPQPLAALLLHTACSAHQRWAHSLLPAQGADCRNWGGKAVVGVC